MKTPIERLATRYQAALAKHLQRRQPTSTRPGARLGRIAANLGLGRPDMVRMHRQALANLRPESGLASPPDSRAHRAQAFFIECAAPIEQCRRMAMQAGVPLKQLQRALKERTRALNNTAAQLEQEILRRQTAEAALKKSQQHHRDLLKRSRVMHEQLRHLSRQIILAQEEERKEISRELHDDIAQILSGINVHLEALSKEAAVNAHELKHRIQRTQQLVTRSVNIVHQFARDLRPTLLDDLGLVAALRSLMKELIQRSGLRMRFTAFTAVDQLGSLKRTVLYRVAQAALANVIQHAQASQVRISLRKLSSDVCLEIHDNGKSFDAERVLFAHGSKRLGLLGMRERVEMVGGSFAVTSAPGQGTTIRARIPLSNGRKT